MNLCPPLYAIWVSQDVTFSIAHNIVFEAMLSKLQHIILLYYTCVNYSSLKVPSCSLQIQNDVNMKRVTYRLMSHFTLDYISDLIAFPISITIR